MFVTGESQYPVERVLLTSGVLTAALDGRFEALGNGVVGEDDSGGRYPDIHRCSESLEGRRMATPWLAAIKYRSYEKLPWRPTGSQPTGALMSAADDRTPPPPSPRDGAARL